MHNQYTIKIKAASFLFGCIAVFVVGCNTSDSEPDELARVSYQTGYANAINCVSEKFLHTKEISNSIKWCSQNMELSTKLVVDEIYKNTE